LERKEVYVIDTPVYLDLYVNLSALRVADMALVFSSKACIIIGN
jgi:hypothetical protein